MGRRSFAKIIGNLDLSDRRKKGDEIPRPWDPELLFGREAPIEFEIGSGKGMFLANAAAAEPGHDFLGVEVAYRYALMAAAGLVKANLSNAMILCADAVVITASAFVFQDIETALYAGIGAVVSAKILDLVLYGSDETKKLLIVSDRHEVIAQRFMKELDTGVTYLEGIGAYTKEKRTVMLCMVKKHHFTRAREIVTEEDRNAFLIVSSASEVFGEGYKKHESEDL